MKKKFLFLVLPLLAMPFVSCGEEEENNNSDSEKEQSSSKGEIVPPDVNGKEYVDLGLPSGTYWAKMNLGATSIEDYGDVYSWGETTTKTIWDDSNYIFYKKGEVNGYTKYITEHDANEMGYQGFYDNKTVLELQDDAAHAEMGGSWRMPTKEDFDELLANCESSWTTYNNVYGYKFTAKNNSWIFLPAGGAGGFDGRFYQGEDGSYWASSLYTSYCDMVWRIYFSEDFQCSVINAWRGYGYSVRGVCAPTKK